LSGIDLEFSKTRKDTQNKSVSIDRIDNKKGYIIGNVQWIHKKINIMKNILVKMNSFSFVIKFQNIK